MHSLKEPFSVIVSRLDEEGQSIAGIPERDNTPQTSNLHPQVTDGSNLSPNGAKIASKPLKISFKGALPGEEVSIQIKYKKWRTLLATLLKVQTPSPDRVPPPCSHFLECGGCSFQHVRYAKQLESKQERIRQLFPEETQIQTILPARMEWGYRGKMEFTFSEDKKGQKYLGLYGEDSKVLASQTECPIAPPWMTEALAIVRKFWDDSSYHAFHLSKMDGTLRYLTMRSSFRTPAKMVILTVFGGASAPITTSDLEKLKGLLRDAFGESLSVFLKVDHIAKGTPSSFSEMHLEGPKVLNEILVLDGLELQCRISPTSFYQPNPSQAEVIYQVALDLTEMLFLENKISSILDLFSGIGMLGLIFAARAKKQGKKTSVTCVELSPYACMDAEEMIELNGLTSSSTGFIQCEVVKADAFEYLQNKQGVYDLVIVDPPRVGLGKALELFATLQAQYILYISCNPKSQSRDVEYLKTLGYQVQRIQPIDQFPHTLHLENVVLLAKSK